jgi:hypothetical protein
MSLVFLRKQEGQQKPYINRFAACPLALKPVGGSDPGGVCCKI